MYTTANDFIEAIKTASNSEEIINIWTEAAKGNNLSMKDIISIHQACGKILLNAVHENHDKHHQNITTKISNL